LGAVQILEVKAVAFAGDVLTVRGGWLDLNHIGAPVGEVPYAGWAGPGESQVQYLQPVQRHARLGLGQQSLVGRALRHPSSPLCRTPILCRNRQRLKRTQMNAVDLALVLAVDGSASVTYEEFGLIAGGMAA